MAAPRGCRSSNSRFGFAEWRLGAECGRGMSAFGLEAFDRFRPKVDITIARPERSDQLKPMTRPSASRDM